jgi:hypothetical protein
MNSPYGETYLNSIKKKIKKGDKKGVFIVTVDPWSISSQTKDPNDSNSFREVNLCLGNTLNVSTKPNFEYLLNNLGGKYYSVLKKKSPLFLHENGWLEVSPNMDSVVVNAKIKSKIEIYRKTTLPIYQYSNLRFSYLKKTIEFLNSYGDVYLVRLPLHPGMMEVENELIPDFNNIVSRVIPMTKGYFDMTPLNSEFTYTDGNHLYKTSGKIVSEKIADWINSLSHE